MPNNPYPLPNDDLEKNRLDTLHTGFYLLFRTNIHVPLNRTPTQISIEPVVDSLLIAKQSTLAQALDDGSLK